MRVCRDARSAERGKANRQRSAIPCMSCLSVGGKKPQSLGRILWASNGPERASQGASGCGRGLSGVCDVRDG